MKPSQGSFRYRIERHFSRRSWRSPIDPFVRLEGESWVEAVERDTRELIERHRELPSIERYSKAIDPRDEPAAAYAAVLAAFDAGPAWIDVLAEAWRPRYPAWKHTIDAAVGISSLDLVPRAMEAAGRRIGPPAPDGPGRYELFERIGQGASGVVFRAVDHVFVACGEPGEVAVKLIPRAAADVEAGLREAGNARRISHGGIARVLDAGRLDPAASREFGCGDVGIFIVHELIHGQPLWIWKACRPERDLDSCLSIVAGIREAIDACHASGIIHGDLNPANVLVEPSGRTRIIDFGRSERSLEHRPAKSGEHDQERIEAMRGWLLRDLRRVDPAPGVRSMALAAAAVAGLGSLVALLVPGPTLIDPGEIAPDVTAHPPVPRAVSDPPPGEYQVFKRDGRVILIPGIQGKTAPTVESIQLLDPGMVNIQLSGEKFTELFGTSTGEVTPEGLAVYRIPKDRFPVPGAAVPPAAVPPAAVPPAERTDRAVRELFGEMPFATGEPERFALARSIVEIGPVDPDERPSRLAIATRLSREATELRRGDRGDPGLELLVAAAFLSAAAFEEAHEHSVHASDRTGSGPRSELATWIHDRSGLELGRTVTPADPAIVRRRSARLGAPGLARFSSAR